MVAGCYEYNNFTVDKVEKATKGIDDGYSKKYDVPTSIQQLIKGNKPEAVGFNTPKVIPCHANGFISALDYAYANHYPLTISPDDIWLTLAQSVAQHIDIHAETLRHHFVQHEGKVKIIWRNDSLRMGSPDNNWMDGFDYFSKEIQSYIGKKHDLLVSSFSTTAAIEKAASEVVLMDAMKNYFSYGVMTMCGIPEVNLLGTTEDWTSIRTRVQALGELEGLGDCVKTLDPILSEFVNASKGKVNTTFWGNIYKEKSHGSGNPHISGWANALFLYLKSPKGNVTNPIAIGTKTSRYGTANDFPSGLSKVPFVWDYYGSEFDYEFLGGFVGVDQDTETLAVRPSIGWAVRSVKELVV